MFLSFQISLPVGIADWRGITSNSSGYDRQLKVDLGIKSSNCRNMNRRMAQPSIHFASGRYCTRGYRMQPTISLHRDTSDIYTFHTIKEISQVKELLMCHHVPVNTLNTSEKKNQPQTFSTADDAFLELVHNVVLFWVDLYTARGHEDHPGPRVHGGNSHRCEAVGLTMVAVMCLAPSPLMEVHENTKHIPLFNKSANKYYIMWCIS